jgi:hypothetical protein
VANARNDGENLADELDLAVREAWACQFVTATLSRTLKKAIGALAEAKANGQALPEQARLESLVGQGNLAFRSLRKLVGIQPSYRRKTTHKRPARRARIIS